MKCLSTTHDCMANVKTVKINNKTQEVIAYQGPSPDEVAILEFAQQHGYEFIAGTDENLKVNEKKKIPQEEQSELSITAKSNPVWANKRTLSFKFLKKMSFNSDRKRMSIVIKDEQDGLFKMYTKGADNVIKERLRPGYFKNKADKGFDDLEFDQDGEDSFERKPVANSKEFDD